MKRDSTWMTPAVWSFPLCSDRSILTEPLGSSIQRVLKYRFILDNSKGIVAQPEIKHPDPRGCYKIVELLARCKRVMIPGYDALVRRPVARSVRSGCRRGNVKVTHVRGADAVFAEKRSV